MVRQERRGEENETRHKLEGSPPERVRTKQFKENQHDVLFSARQVDVWTSLVVVVKY